MMASVSSAARGVKALQLFEQGWHVIAIHEMLGESSLIQRLGGCEQQRFNDAQFFALIGRLQRDDIGGKRQEKPRPASLALRLVFLHDRYSIQLVRCHSLPRSCCLLGLISSDSRAPPDHKRRE